MPRAEAISTITIPDSTLFKVKKRAADSRIEICGLFAGTIEKGQAFVVSEFELTNCEQSACRFSVAPDEYKGVLSTLPRGREIVAFYHSHLHAPDPSGRDMSDILISPFAWVILGFAAYGDPESIEIKAIAPKGAGRELATVEIISQPG